MRVAKKTVIAVVAGLALVVLSACTPDFATQNSGDYIMEIAGIAPTNGDPGSTIYVDVAQYDKTTGAATVVNTDADVSVNILRKNSNGGYSVSAIQHVYLDSYEVRFFRTDGRNTEGVDVPYRITGALGNVRYHTPDSGQENEATVTITIVRQQAKLEPPLINLRAAGGAMIITTVMEVTIYGHQLNGGQGLKAVGRAQVTFADFPDA